MASMTFDQLMQNKKRTAEVDPFESSSELAARKKQATAADAYSRNLLRTVSAMSMDTCQVVCVPGYNGGDTICVQQKGATGNWPGRFDTPPMKLKWSDLTGDGNLGSQYGPDKKSAKYRAVLELGTAPLLKDEFSQATDEAQAKFAENVKDISDKVFIMMLHAPEMLTEKTKKFLAMHAKMRKCKVEDLNVTTDDDLLDAWKDEYLSTPVKWSQSPVQISIDSRAFKKDYKSGSDELHRSPVPIFDRKGNRLNDNDENTCDIGNGDLVKCSFKFTTYTTPMHAFGTKFELVSITLLKKGEGSSGGAADYAECDDIFD
tara:strand:+ start:1818 stop:2768 length:951 start_codon:yes stop_codon:yes gene_type:complete